MMDNNTYNDETFYKDYKKSIGSIEPNTTMKDIDWNKISSRLPNKEEKKRPVYLWLSAAAIFGFVISLSVISYNSTLFKYLSKEYALKTASKVKTEDFSKSTLESRFKFNESSNGPKSTNVTGLIDKYVSQPFEQKNALRPIQSRRNKDKINEEQPVSFERRINDQSNSPSSFVSTNVNQARLTQPEPSTKFENNSDSLMAMWYIQSMTPMPLDSIIKNAPLQLKPLSTILFQSQPLLDQNLKRYIKNLQNKTQWSGRLSYGKYFEKNHLEYSLPDHSPSVKESIASSKNGQQMDIFLLRSLNNNWRLGLGVKYISLHFETSHNVTMSGKDISYHSTNTDNIKKYNYSYNLFDGSVSSKVRLSLFEISPNQIINASDTFNVSMSIFRNISHIQIPLIAERKLLKFNKLALYGKFGTALSVQTKVKNSLENHNENCKELCLINEFVPEIVSTASKKIDISGIVGLGLEYKLNQKFSVGINPDIIIHPNHNYTSWLHQQSLGLYLTFNIK